MATEFREQLSAREVAHFGTADYQAWQHDLMQNLWEAGRDDAAKLVALELEFVESQIEGCRLLEAASMDPTPQYIERYAAWLEDHGHEQHAAIVRARTPSEFSFITRNFELPPFHATQRDQLREVIGEFLEEHGDIEAALLEGLVLDRNRRSAVGKKARGTVAAVSSACISSVLLVFAGYSYLSDRPEAMVNTIAASGASAIATAITTALATLFHWRAQSLAARQQAEWNDCPLRCIDPNR